MTKGIPKINLRDWYSQSQVMNLLDFAYREQVKRWLADNPTIVSINICGKPYYLRQSVNSYLNDLVRRGTLNPFQTEKNKLKQVAYDISTDEWLPRCYALQLIEQAESTFYEKAEKRIFALIRSKKIYGFKWFNRQDIEDFLIDGLTIEEVSKKRRTRETTESINLNIPDRFFEN